MKPRKDSRPDRMEGLQVRIHDQQDAIAAYVAYRGGSIPEGYHVTASCAVDLGFILDDGQCLWRVGFYPDHEEDWIIGGMTTILGPDGKDWTMSTNRNFHDREIAERALTHLYIEGVADLVDPEALADRIELITRQRDEAIFALADAARHGELRRTKEDG
jgi:uncharacterized protein YfcZ (UPF0381/DUF406 family)